MKNYYRILDIPDNADLSDIERAYTKLKNLITKNSVSLYSILPSSEKEAFLKDIEEAYQTLRTPEKRSLYDMKLKGVSVILKDDDSIQGSKQLTFEFAREAFTFVDYRKKNEEIFFNAIDRIRNDYLLETKGPSITIIEEIKENKDIQTEDLTAKDTASTIEKAEKLEETARIEPVNTKLQADLNEVPTKQVIETETKKEVLPYSGQNIVQTQTPDELTTNISPSDTTKTTKTPTAVEATNNSCQDDQLIIDENTEFSGSLLRRIREKMGLTIKDIAHITKITTANLNNIEEERYNELPALVYVKGYLTQIARCLNLRPDLVVRSYVQRMNERMEKKSR